MPSHHKSHQVQVKHRHQLAQRASINPKTLHKKIRPRDFPKGLRQIPIDNLTNGFDIRLEPQVSQETSPTIGIMDLHGAPSYTDHGYATDTEVYAPILPVNDGQTSDHAAWYTSPTSYELSAIPDITTGFTQGAHLIQEAGITTESQGGDVLWDASGINQGFGASVNCWPELSSFPNYPHMEPMQTGQHIYAHWGEIPSLNLGNFPQNAHTIFMQSPCDGFDNLAGGTVVFDGLNGELDFGTASDSLPYIMQLWTPATNDLLDVPAFFFS